jgi:polyhydroxybutyrate depolymerase
MSKKYTLTLTLVLLLTACSSGSATSSQTDNNNDGNNGGNEISAPIASFTFSSSEGEAPYDITFTSTSTGDINSWLWNIDDDADYESNNQSFTHTYENAGTYDISLIVTGAGGQSTMVEEDAIIITEPDTSTETGLLSRSMNHDNGTREYLIYIPQGYDTGNETPVLFAFHGFGGYSQNFINTADFRSLAEQYNFIVVYPQALVCGDGTTWNTAEPGGDNKCSQDDIGFFAALLNEISNNYTINAQKVYLTGYSNGAGFSYAMACYQSDLVTAISPVSGLMPMDNPQECTPNRPVSSMVFNGTSDDSRPYNGIEGYMMPVDDTITYWVGYNNTDSNPQTGTEGSIEYFSYQNGDSNSAVELYKINNGGHDWFNLSYNGYAMEEIIWNFFSQHTSD